MQTSAPSFSQGPCGPGLCGEQFLLGTDPHRVLLPHNGRAGGPGGHGGQDGRDRLHAATTGQGENLSPLVFCLL